MKTYRVTYWDFATGTVRQIRVSAYDIQGALYGAGNTGIPSSSIRVVEEEIVCQDFTQKEVGS